MTTILQVPVTKRGMFVARRSAIGILLFVLALGAYVFINHGIGVNSETVASEKEMNQLPGLTIGVKAPDFELKTLDGKMVRLSDYKGQKVMLNFWATWCPPCKEEIPDMEKFYKSSGDKIQIFAVNLDPTSDVAGFAKKMGATFPILLDEAEKVMDLYQVLTIPTTYFIDEDGIIRKKYVGAMTLKTMEMYLNEL